MLLDGRRPLLGEGVPRGAGRRGARRRRRATSRCSSSGQACRRSTPSTRSWCRSAAREHDWAALELGAWIARATQRAAQAPRCRAAATVSATRAGCSAHASLVVQQLAGIAAEPVLVELGERRPRRRQPQGAGLLVVGLSDRWRERGTRARPRRRSPGRAGSDPVRPPGHAAGRARAAHRGRDAVRLVARRADRLGLS